MAQVTSGSFSTNQYQGGTGKKGLIFEWSRTSTNIENNYSTIHWTWKGAGTGTTYHELRNSYLNINGSRVYTQPSGTIQLKVGTKVAEGDLDIPHSADGTKTFSADGGGGVYTAAVNCTGSGSWELTTIPRASTFTVSGGTLGSTISVSITRASSSFTHKVYCKLGSRSQTISSSAGTSASATLSMDFANGITTGDSNGNATATATMYVETYSGSTLIGTTTKTFTMTVPSSVKPTIGTITTSDTSTVPNTSSSNLSVHGAYVQGKSNLKIQIPVTIAYSSTISNVTVTLKRSGSTLRSVNASYNSSTSKYETTFSGITYTGSISIEVSVKDARNRTTTNNSSNNPSPITVAVYENPKITTYTAARLNNDSTITIKLSGSITNINSHNSNRKDFYVWCREKGTSSWGSAIISSSTYTYNNTSNPYTITKSEDKSWQFLVNVTDSYTTTSQTIEVGTVFELINWKDDGTGMAIGKVSEKSNTFEVGLNTEFTGVLDVKNKLTFNKYIDSDFTNNFTSVIGSGAFTTIRKSGTWASTYFPNYSTGIAWNTASQGGFLIPAQNNYEVDVGGVSNDVVQWTDKCLLEHHTSISNWTPTLACVGETGPTATYSSRSGKYCKLGNICFFEFYIRAKITALNGTNNYASISGLPYDVAGLGFGTQAGNVGVLYAATNISSTDQATFIISEGAIHIQGGRGAGRTKWIVTTTSYMEIAGSGWYFISAS